MNPVKNKIPLVLLALVIVLFTMSCASTVKTTASTNVGKAATESDKQREAARRRIQTEESMKRDAALTMKIMKDNAPKVRLNEYFNAVAYAADALSAYNSMTKALVMFAFSETLVLTVIGEQNGKKQYGQPTTITAYFNYLKDAKVNIDDILNLKMDNRGRIIEVELKRASEINGSANQ